MSLIFIVNPITMALCRCAAHAPHVVHVHIYTNWVLPIGYPNTSSLCGTVGCEEPGRIYLTEVEFEQYQNGEDVFAFANNTTKVWVQQPPIHGVHIYQ
jgi:hypothetical protein